MLDPVSSFDLSPDPPLRFLPRSLSGEEDRLDEIDSSPPELDGFGSKGMSSIDDLVVFFFLLLSFPWRVIAGHLFKLL